MRLRWIDALRGYAIIAVIGAHLGYIGNGARGVQLFFLASAIALLHSWHGRKDGAVAFYIRRAFRITPAFWVAILAFALLLAIGGHAPTVGQVISTAFFSTWAIPTWHNSVVPGSWSIMVEVLFYVAFPLLAATVDNFGRSVIALALSIVIGAICWPLLLSYGQHFGLSAKIRPEDVRFHVRYHAVSVLFRWVLCVFREGHIGAPDGASRHRRSRCGCRHNGRPVARFALYGSGRSIRCGRLQPLAWASRRTRHMAGYSNRSRELQRIFLAIRMARGRKPVRLEQPIRSPSCGRRHLLCSIGSYRLVELPGIRLGRLLARRYAPANLRSAKS